MSDIKAFPLTRYNCFRVNREFCIDGNLDKYPWKLVTKSAPFVDMVTGAPAFLETRCAVVWDQLNLYIAFWIREPDIRADFTERDSRVYLENDVEVFIGGKDCYYEFQINARGTIYEVFYIWQDAYTRNCRFNTAEFDLLTGSVDVIGGFQDETRFEKHPRGRRWAFMDWDYPGLQSGVEIAGTLNDSSDIDIGWTVELAFPWQGMKTLLGPGILPLKGGDELRIDFSRFEKLSYNGITSPHHPGWSLNPHGVYDSHLPEKFSIVRLQDEVVKT